MNIVKFGKIKNYFNQFIGFSYFPSILILSLFLQSCATPPLRQTARNIRKEVKSGNYEKALKVVLSEPSFKEKKTSLLLHMEQGLIYHLMDKTEESLKEFNTLGHPRIKNPGIPSGVQ